MGYTNLKKSIWNTILIQSALPQKLKEDSLICWSEAWIAWSDFFWDILHPVQLSDDIASISMSIAGPSIPAVLLGRVLVLLLLWFKDCTELADCDKAGNRPYTTKTQTISTLWHGSLMCMRNHTFQVARWPGILTFGQHVLCYSQRARLTIVTASN